MYPYLNRLLVLFLLLLLHIGAKAQQDCSTAINVCATTYIQNNSFSGSGSVEEITPGTTCLENGEVNSAWYAFTATTTGNLEFQLGPLNLNDDYDFALFDVTNSSCAEIEAGANAPVSCNYSATAGSTGISAAGSSNSNGSGGPNQNAVIPVQAGQSFVLSVSNFTSSQTGYSLDFNGSASIIDDVPPLLDSVNLLDRCNPDEIILVFNELFNCSSVAGDASDVMIAGPSALNIIQVASLGCVDDHSNRLRLTFDASIPVAGTYTVSITSGTDGNTILDACGNAVVIGESVQFEIENIGPELLIDNVVHATCGESNGSADGIVSAGTAPFVYDWSNTSPTQTTSAASNLGTGTYWLTVTDANDCSIARSVTIENNSPIDISNTSVTPVTCSGSLDGTASVTPVGGVAPVTVEWLTNPTQQGNSISNISGGTWNFIVTDATGCSESGSVIVPSPPSINPSISLINPDCGQANGEANLSVSGGAGGFTYLWDSNPVQTTQSATGLPAGIYSVEITDQNGCSTSSNVILVDNFAPNATIEDRFPDCGQGVGQATASPTTGTWPYTYEWSTTPVQTNATATNLTEGDYYVTITDAASCVQIIYVKIDSVPPPVLTGNMTQPGCGLSNGGIEALVADGVSPFTYAWSSSGNTTSVEAGLAAGNYTVTVTDSIGCTDTEDFVLEQLEPQSEVNSNDVCDGEQVSFSSTTTSGATVWSWDFGDGNNSDQENPNHTYTSPGQYEVTLILEGGCMNDTVVQMVNVFDPPTATFVMDPEIATTRTNAQFVYTGNGGTDFLWDFGDGNISTESNPFHLFEVDGFYTISMQTTDANGCEDTTSMTIEVLLQPVVYLPNAFMPEGTSENSRFRGYGIGITAAELSIFNRWGTLLYFSNDVNEITLAGWDGSFNGKAVNQGVYAYKIKASFYNNSTFEKLGTVTLIR